MPDASGIIVNNDVSGGCFPFAESDNENSKNYISFKIAR